MNLTARDRLQLIESVLKKEKNVTQVCRESGISRKTFYKWLKRFREAPEDRKLESLEYREWELSRHGKKTPTEIERSVLGIVARNPRLGYKGIQKKLVGISDEPVLSRHAIKNILSRYGIGDVDAKEEFGKLKEQGELTPQERFLIFEATLKEGRPIVQVCRELGISRKTYYKWLKRYQKSKELTLETFNDKPWGIKEHPRKISEEKEREILNVVRENPSLSSHKLSKVVGIGNNGVHRVLVRNGLSTHEQRKVYALQHGYVSEPAIRPLVSWQDRLKQVWEQFLPSRAPAPPPLRARLRGVNLPGFPSLLGFFQRFSTSILLSIFILFILFSWGRFLGSAATIPQAIGWVLASIALLMGTVFFLYSLKYYFTLAVVLSFSREESVVSDSTTPGVGISFTPGVTPKSSASGQEKSGVQGWLARLFGISKFFTFGFRSGNENTPVSGSYEVGSGGLEPDLTQLKLEREPFVSIHLPMYNEKRVAERVLKACTAIDYDNYNYEVVVVDDSTDETTEIIKRFLKGSQGKLREIKGNKGETIIKPTPANPDTPSLTLIHRSDRSGFKGGALQEALKHTDPRAEFVVVFDADFVPYPDTLELFLKYFQANAGTLGVGSKEYGVGSKSKGYQDSNSAAIQGYQWPRKDQAEPDQRGKHVQDYRDSPVAAIQGYQWHVLNKSENWITRGVRSEYAGSYVIERSGEELYGGLKQIAGSVYMIRRDLLDRFGWETSITEDFQLTLKLYEAGYKVIYTPYIQAPSECVSTLKRLIRQRMRWAEGHSHNIRKMFARLLNTKQLTLPEKLEFLYLAPYYLQAALFLLGTLSWLTSETIFGTRLPFWTAVWGWSLVLTNLLSLPLMNTVGLFLEEAEERDFTGILSFILLSYILVPFQAYASVKGFLEAEEGPWFRTPKTGKITDILTRGKFYRFIRGIFPGRLATAMRMDANREPMDANFALAFQSANRTFSGFTIRRRNSWMVSKAVVSLLIIVSTVLLSLAPAVTSLSYPIQVQASTFGMLKTPEQNIAEVNLAVSQAEAGNEVYIGRDNRLALNTVQNPGIATSGNLGNNNSPGTKLKFANGVEMDFPYTDENSEENLIIRTDKPNYYELAKAEVNFSVTSIGLKEERVDFQVYFPGEQGEIYKIEKWTKDVPYEVIVGDLGSKTFTCEGEWQEFSDEEGNPIGYKCPSSGEEVHCSKLSEDKRQCLRENYQIDTHKETRHKDAWEEVSLKEGPTPNLVALSSEKRKAVPVGFNSAKHAGNNLILPGETQFFRMEIGFPIDSSGEFFIEAIGDKGGYGQLDPWWDSSWKYKRPVPITYSGGSLSNFQVRVDVNTKELVDSGKLQSNCNDIRFVDSNEGAGDQINYWIESGCNTTATTLWVKVPSISGNKTIYMYYGNLLASAGSNGDNTFDGFDDFPGTSLDTGKWTDYDPDSFGTMSVASSILTIEMPSTGGVSNAYTRGIMSNSTFSFSDHVIETYSKWQFNTMSANTEHVTKQVHLSDTFSPTRMCSYQFDGDGNQFKLHYRRYYGLFGINTHTYKFTKCTDGVYSEPELYNLNNDAPSNYEWERYEYYTGPNETSARSTDGSSFSTLWAAQTDSLFSLPASLYWGFSMTNRSKPNTHYAYLDWIRIRKYASTSPTTTVGAEASIYPTAYSFQRKTFYDSTNSVFWRFSYDGSQIDIEYNADPQSGGWTAITSLSINTSDFSLWDDNIYVYIAYSSTYDIRVRRGTLGSTSISWGSEYTALDGTGNSAFYEYAYISQDSSGILWVVGRYHDGTYYYLRARPSSSANDPSSWGTLYDLSSTSGTDANVYGVISSLASQNMYAAWIRGTAIEGKKFTSGTGWDASATAIGTGKSGLTSNISMSSDTGNNLHLAYIDGSDFVQYKKYSSSWDASPTRLDTAATNEYVSVSVDTSNNDIYVLYIRSSTGYYKKYSGSWGSETNTGWSMGTSPVYLTSNYADSSRIYAEWTSGSSYPYTLNWDYIIIPERLWLFFGLTPFLPRLLKVRRRKAELRKI